MPIQLTERQQQILGATVRHYIATAEPVGSKALVDEYNLGVSSATIRNAMGVLEKAGLLFQPHTSAGRVPSDSGYRIYVDHLVIPSEALALQVENTLQKRLKWEDWSLEVLLQGAAQILATISGCITLITMPQNSMSVLRHLQLLQVEPGRVMLIVVTDCYETHSALVDLPLTRDGNAIETDVIDRELQLVSNFLNSHLRGSSLLELVNLDWSQLDQEFWCYGDFLRTSLLELSRRTTSQSTTLMVRGVSEVLRQPEFSQLQQVQTIIHLLEEEQDQLWRLIFDDFEVEDTGKPKVTVRIGSENPLEPIQTCTLISSTYRRGGFALGSVGVLGPTRLNYDRAIAVVSAAAECLSDAFR